MNKKLVVWFPVCKRLRVSLLNVENVLNPPQKPTTQNILADAEIICLLSAKPITKPTIKQAKIFTINVPRGKFVECIELIHFPSPNLIIPPSPLPIKI